MEGFTWNLYQDNSKEEVDWTEKNSCSKELMGLTTSFLTTYESRNMNGNCQEWYNIISKDKVGELHFGMQDEECLNASIQNMCWASCLILSIAWRIITSREILKKNWRMRRILDEPSCRSSMKNSGNKTMIETKRSWKHKVKPCNDLDGALRWYNRENLELRKEIEPRITSSWTNSERRN